VSDIEGAFGGAELPPQRIGDSIEQYTVTILRSELNRTLREKIDQGFPRVSSPCRQEQAGSFSSTNWRPSAVNLVGLPSTSPEEREGTL